LDRRCLAHGEPVDIRQQPGPGPLAGSQVVPFQEIPELVVGTADGVRPEPNGTEPMVGEVATGVVSEAGLKCSHPPNRNRVDPQLVQHGFVSSTVLIDARLREGQVRRATPGGFISNTDSTT